MVSVLGSLVGSFIVNRTAPNLNDLSPSVKKLVPILEKLNTKVDKIEGLGSPKAVVDIMSSLDRLEAGVDDIANTKDAISNGSLDFSKRVICVNRQGKVICIPEIPMPVPDVKSGMVRECIMNGSRLACGEDILIK